MWQATTHGEKQWRGWHILGREYSQRATTFWLPCVFFIMSKLLQTSYPNRHDCCVRVFQNVMAVAYELFKMSWMLHTSLPKCHGCYIQVFQNVHTSFQKCQGCCIQVFQNVMAFSKISRMLHTSFPKCHGCCIRVFTIDHESNNILFRTLSEA